MSIKVQIYKAQSETVEEYGYSVTVGDKHYYSPGEGELFGSYNEAVAAGIDKGREMEKE